jgi:hypothetical protein
MIAGVVFRRSCLFLPMLTINVFTSVALSIISIGYLVAVIKRNTATDISIPWQGLFFLLGIVCLTISITFNWLMLVVSNAYTEIKTRQ